MNREELLEALERIDKGLDKTGAIYPSTRMCTLLGDLQEDVRALIARLKAEPPGPVRAAVYPGKYISLVKGGD